MCKLEFIVLFCVRVESLDTLERTNAFLPLTDCTFLANKNCDSQTVKKLNSVAVGGHAPTATPTGKFYGKLCARNEVTSARFAVKFCRRLQSRAPPAADTARRSRGSGRRAQARLCAHRAMRTPQPGDSKGKNSRGNQCKTSEYHSYQRARRADAEPITRRSKCGYRLFLFDNCLCCTIAS